MYMEARHIEVCGGNTVVPDVKKAKWEREGVIMG